MPFTKYENSRLRADNLVFGLRALQVIFALTILGVAANDVTIWGPKDCNVPPKLAFNVAAVSVRIVGAVRRLANNKQGRYNTSHNRLPLVYYRSTCKDVQSPSLVSMATTWSRYTPLHPLGCCRSPLQLHMQRRLCRLHSSWTRIRRLQSILRRYRVPGSSCFLPLHHHRE